MGKLPFIGSKMGINVTPDERKFIRMLKVGAPSLGVEVNGVMRVGECLESLKCVQFRVFDIDLLSCFVVYSTCSNWVMAADNL